ncbi:MAG: HEAT repeat domain-containing protein, partial [Myxococcales bacterium]|nr:HEAT repeat domain-containing protein [Myxococcales bacterium]
MSTAAVVSLHQQARQALRAGNGGEALNLLWQALDKTTAREAEYQAMLVDLRALLARQRMFRAALSVDWYRGDGEAERELLEQVPVADRARTLESWAELERDPGRAKKRWAAAAEVYEEAALPARAAVCRERALDFEQARVLWSRLASALEDGPDRYAAALARFNLARASNVLGDKAGAHQAVVGSVHLLEEAADRYEQIGQRERAFDCYQVLLAIGKQSDEFEHVLEGIVNAVRILREDHLRYYALQQYEEALGMARERGEFAAGATLASEMAQYAAAQGMPQLAAHGIRTSALMWQSVAEAAQKSGLPAELAENALLAAVASFARQGQFARVGQLYTSLSELELGETRRAAYARSAKRYVSARDGGYEGAPLPAHLRQDTSYPDVWHVDLIEWEQQGSAAEACADVLLDKRWPDLVRRKAMLARSLGMSATAAHYILVQADLWRSVAKQHAARGAPAEIAE